MMHAPTCRCDECVLKLTDKRTRKAILSRLGIHGAIPDSWDGEHRAELAIARALLDLQESGGEGGRP